MTKVTFYTWLISESRQNPSGLVADKQITTFDIFVDRDLNILQILLTVTSKTGQTDSSPVQKHPTQSPLYFTNLCETKKECFQNP